MRKTTFLILVIAVFISQAVKAQQTDSTEAMDPKAAAHYNDAIQMMKAEKYEDALKDLDSTLMISKDYRAYYLQGEAYLKLNKIDDAKKSYSECLQLKPDYDLGLIGSGNAHLAAKEYELAQNDFKKAADVTKDPQIKKTAEESLKLAQGGKAIDYFNQGNEFYKQEKFEDAVKSYDQALAVSKDPKYFYQKGLALSRLDKMKEAEDAFKSAIALNDSFDIGYIALASIQTANKQYDDAVKNFEKAMTVAKDENMKANIKESISKTYLVAGNNALKDKKYDQSIQWMQKSVNNSPNDAAYLGLAKAYIEKKKYTDATKALDSAKAQQKTVSEGSIAYYMGVIQLNKGENNKALESFTVASNDPVYKKASEAQIDYIKKLQKSGK